MAKFIVTLRTHPKKSVFACGLVAYCYNYLADKYRQDLLRRRLCNLVKPLGNASILPTSRLRRLTVFLNPFARRGQLLKDFEKNVAPILQLSGLDIQMVYTDNDVEVKDFVTVLDPSSTDGILIASDDHVLQKAVTALIQSAESKIPNIRNIPVGVVPLGVWNVFANSLVLRENPVQWCNDMLSSVLEQRIQRRHVLEITSIVDHQSTTPDASVEPLVEPGDTVSPADSATAVVDTSVVAGSPRKTYSLLGLEWSVWRDVEHGGGFGSAKSKPIDTNEHRGVLTPLSIFAPRSWIRHIGALRRHCWFWLTSTRPPSLPSSMPSSAAVVNSLDQRSRSSFRHRFHSKQARLVYTVACDGCSKCWTSRLQQRQLALAEASTPSKPPESMFSRLFGLSKTNRNCAQVGPDMAMTVEDRSHVINEECGLERTLHLNNLTGIVLALDAERIRMDIYRTSTGLLDYICRSLSRLRTSAYVRAIGPDAAAAATSLTDCPDTTYYCSSVRLYPMISQNEFYWIDNDHFETCPVEVRVKLNALNMYA